MHDFARGPPAGTFLHGLLEWAGRQGFAALAKDPVRLAIGIEDVQDLTAALEIGLKAAFAG